MAVRIALAALPLLLSGCDAAERVSAAAESARAATERMGEASVARSNLKEAQILADARLIEADAAKQAGGEFDSGPRYKIKRDGSGWTVYDSASNRAAKIGPKFQSGLSREDAEAAFADLQRDEEEFGVR